MLEILSANIHI